MPYTNDTIYDEEFSLLYDQLSAIKAELAVTDAALKAAHAELTQLAEQLRIARQAEARVASNSKPRS